MGFFFCPQLEGSAIGKSLKFFGNNVILRSLKLAGSCQSRSTNITALCNSYIKLIISVFPYASFFLRTYFEREWVKGFYMKVEMFEANFLFVQLSFILFFRSFLQWQTQTLESCVSYSMQSKLFLVWLVYLTEAVTLST